MRIAIREQLALLVIFATLVALAVVSIPVWIYVNNFVTGVQQNALSLTASLKAARIAAEIDLIQTTCQTIATRVLLQKALTNFYNGSDPITVFDMAKDDVSTALNVPGSPDLLQARIYSRNTTGSPQGLMNVTSRMFHNISLPYNHPDGSPAVLADTADGYPPQLYPNLTYINTYQPSIRDPETSIFYAMAFPDVRLTDSGLLLGPLIVNETFAMISLTVPVRANSNSLVLGYMTLVASASSFLRIRNSPEGLGRTGMTLIVGPHSRSNRFNGSDPASNGTYKVPDEERFGNLQVQYVLPPRVPEGVADRHTNHNFQSGGYDDSFTMKDYPLVLASLASLNGVINNARSNLWTTNEQGLEVSVGTARPGTSFVDWLIIVEQDRGEALAAIVTLRDILLGCVFGTAGLMALVIFPCAHLSVRPIRALKSATERSILPPGYEEDPNGESSASPGSGVLSSLSEKGWIGVMIRKTQAKWNKHKKQRRSSAHDTNSSHRRAFRIPAKVTDRKHWIQDELTELTTTFNSMSDELYAQYSSLDQKVAQRTRDLELSKKAAETANESKTLFIANISHELKTPLNGIMGMCAICMEETDISRIKQSLKTLYKSGDLLLHLLEDLLSFSKNQIGHRIGLETKEFRLGDIRAQLLSIFDKQVRENRINFTVEFVGSDILESEGQPTTQSLAPGPGPGSGQGTGSGQGLGPGYVSEKRHSMETRLPALGPPGAGRLKDMCVWGDQQRILQVIINLVSNSLKFTPAGGKVDLRIRCCEEIDQAADDKDDKSRSSSFSRSGSGRAGRTRHRLGSSSAHSASSQGLATPSAGQYAPGAGGTALAINPLEPKSGAHIHIGERSPTPPPPGAKSYMFEFEVEDSGPGIPEHMRLRVFEPFVQGDLGLSKKYGGTGLGLSICQQLAGLMGGGITLRSTMGVGSVFTMRIPLKYVKDRASSTASSSMKSRPPSVSSVDGENARNPINKPGSEAGKTAAKLDNKPRLVGLSYPFFSQANDQSSPNKEVQKAELDRKLAKAAAEKGRKLRVLVADDNSTNIEVVSKMLSLEHVSDVTVATDGREALEVVRANMENNLMFDLIFMDIQMPNLDGLQSTRLIRKLGYSAPIVALTAFSEESNVKECMESGMDEFLAKPIRRPALKQVLQKFATIPEEPETASLTRKTTPDKSSKNSPTEEKSSAVPDRKKPGAGIDLDGAAAAPNGTRTTGNSNSKTDGHSNGALLTHTTAPPPPVAPTVASGVAPG